MDLTMSQAKQQFQLGNLSAFYFERHLEGWSVYFTLKSQPVVRSYLLDTRRKEVKAFKSLDAAVNAVEEVGFVVAKMQTC